MPGTTVPSVDLMNNGDYLRAATLLGRIDALAGRLRAGPAQGLRGHRRQADLRTARAGLAAPGPLRWNEIGRRVLSYQVA